MHHFSYCAILLYMVKEIPYYAFCKVPIMLKSEKKSLLASYVLFFLDFPDIQLCFVHSMYK